MRFFIFAVLILQAPFLRAQDSVLRERLIPIRALKVSPLHLLNFYPTIQLSVEQRIRPRFTLQAEAGYVLNYTNDDFSFQDKRGVKLKLEGRYYFGSASGRKRIYYSAIEPYANIINFDRDAEVTECFDLECNHLYTRRYDYRVTYREHGVSVKVGVLGYLGAHLFLDFSSGLTLRNICYDEPPLVRGFNEVDGGNIFQIPNEDDRIAISPNLGLRLGYRLR